EDGGVFRLERQETGERRPVRVPREGVQGIEPIAPEPVAQTLERDVAVAVSPKLDPLDRLRVLEQRVPHRSLEGDGEDGLACCARQRKLGEAPRRRDRGGTA